MLAIQLSDDARVPVIVDERELFRKIDLLHDEN
jgi:hypothetical protein